MRKLSTALLLLVMSGQALAYVGPGAGISVLGALWGLIIGVVMAVGVILFWPIRMMLRKKKGDKEADADEDTGAEDAQSEPAARESAKPAETSEPG